MKVATKKFPPLLYHYRSLQSLAKLCPNAACAEYKCSHPDCPRRNPPDRAAEVFLENKIWFSTAPNLNDPFDIRPLVAAPRRPTFEEVKEAGKKYAVGNRKQRRAQEAHRRKDYGTPKGLAEYQAQMQEALLDQIRMTSIACFCERIDHLTMWAHYAKNHEGYCLGFDFNVTWTYDYHGRDFTLFPDDVDYVDKYPVVNPDYNKDSTDEAVEFFRKGLLTKSKDWSYEQEWRVCRPGYGDGHQVFPEASLQTVTFGARMPPARRAELIEMIRSRKHVPRLFQAKLSATAFKLEFVEIT